MNALSAIVVATIAQISPQIDWNEPHFNPREVQCLALNIYHEARGEGELGMAYVARVTRNRVALSRFPSNYCAVVFQRNQFEWTSKRKRPRVKDMNAWRVAVKVAAMTIVNWIDVEISADHYYNYNLVNPKWKDNMREIGTYKNHVFFAEK